MDVYLYPQWRHAGEKGWSFNGGPAASWSVKPHPGKTYWFYYAVRWEQNSVVALKTIRSKLTVPGVRFDSSQSYQQDVGLVAGSTAVLFTPGYSDEGGRGMSLNGRLLPNPAKQSCPSVAVKVAHRRATFRPICFPLR